MKIHPQTIYNGVEAEFIVLPIKEYKKILQKLQDLEDIQEIKNHIDNPSENFSMEVVMELSSGVNPIKVYRQYRGISQISLAEKAGVSKQYISQLELGDRIGTVKVLRQIAKALQVDLDDISN